VHTSSTINKKVTLYYYVLLSCISIIIPHRYFYSTILYFRIQARGIQQTKTHCIIFVLINNTVISRSSVFSTRVKSMTGTMTINYYNNIINFRHFSKISRNAYVLSTITSSMGYTCYNNMRLYRLPTARFIHLSLDVIYKL